MRTKILFFITKSNFGGAQRYVYDLATSLPKKDYDVVVALGGNGPLKQKLEDVGIRTISLTSLTQRKTFLGDLFSFGSLFEIISVLRTERPNVVHANSAKAGGLGAFAARLVGVPKIIFTAHGWEFNASRSFLSKIGIRFFSWLTLLLSHVTICVSEAIRRDVLSWPFVKKKLVIIHNGVRPVELLSKEDARAKLISLHSRLAHYQDDTWIGTVAELHPVKGLPYAIDAIAQLRDKNPTVRYLILSDGKERKNLETLIREKGLEEHVFLLGYVDEAPRYGKAYDIFLLPSLSEALALAILEAGQAELPVVATNVGGIPEVIKHETNGLLVPSKNSAAISESLQRLIDDSALRDSLGTSLKERVSHDFSLERVVRETKALYHA